MLACKIRLALLGSAVSTAAAVAVESLPRTVATTENGATLCYGRGHIVVYSPAPGNTKSSHPTLCIGASLVRLAYYSSSNTG